MRRGEGTAWGWGNPGGVKTTPPDAPPRASFDRRYIRSLLIVDTTAPASLVSGNGDAEKGTTNLDTQWTGDPSREAFSIVPPGVSPIATPTLRPKQEWEGRVTAIREDEFDARLLDLTAGDEVDCESATMGLEEADRGDRAMMRVGSIFRWVIGYEKTVGGRCRNVSRIVFLDPPRLTERDLERGTRVGGLAAAGVGY